ncbi:hypothetical protein HHI36_020478 [Cryptolaemus montrouzieri]|uniref:Uncharacterized protein n=1 Tax=Cryptolaemus montrouzieri TaxID=559131 RepID=A0ABD2NAD7_9CUCU
MTLKQIVLKPESRQERTEYGEAEVLLEIGGILRIPQPILVADITDEFILEMALIKCDTELLPSTTNYFGAHFNKISRRGFTRFTGLEWWDSLNLKNGIKRRFYESSQEERKKKFSE